jgi:hypothetical protein
MEQQALRQKRLLPSPVPPAVMCGEVKSQNARAKSGALNRAINGLMNGPFEGQSNGPISGLFGGPVSGPMRGPFEGPIHGPIAGPFEGPICGPIGGQIDGPFQGPLAARFCGSSAACGRAPRGPQDAAVPAAAKPRAIAQANSTTSTGSRPSKK